MDDKLLFAIIPASSAVVGVLVGSIISLWSTKISADREDRRRREEIERQTAKERLENLYEPLLKIMSPGPPYDEFYLDHKAQEWVVKKVEKSEIYASPDLLSVYWRFRDAHYNHPDDIDKGLDWEIFDVAVAEHDKLKSILGYGRILKKKYFFVVWCQKMVAYFERKWREIKRSRFARNARRRKARKKE